MVSRPWLLLWLYQFMAIAYFRKPPCGPNKCMFWTTIKVIVRVGIRKVYLNPSMMYYWPFQIGAFVVVPSCSMFVSSTLLIHFTIMSLVFSYAQILSHHLFESCWHHLSYLIRLLASLRAVTSFPCGIIGRVWNLIVSVSDPCSFHFLLWYCSGYSFNIIIALMLLFSGILALFRALYLSHCFPFTFAVCCCLEQCKIKQKGKIFCKVKPQWLLLLNRKRWYFFLWLVVVVDLSFFFLFFSWQHW